MAIADYSWPYFLPHFDISGKWNYKQMSVLVTRVGFSMTDDVKKFYDAVRTASWGGVNGSNMFWDQTQETANNLIKPHMGEVEDDNLGDCVTRLNGIKDVATRMLHYFGEEGARESKGTRVELNDIETGVGKLKETLGATFAQLCRKKSNPFRLAPPGGPTRSGHVADNQGPSRPWEHMRAVRAHRDLTDYVKETLDGVPDVLTAEPE